ncbi:MAG: phospho-sugar mutase, partial [Clostridia bacterium]|nr:phospho-sugar mutase [Clostridia bacterium]
MYKEEYKKWISFDGLETELKNELESISGNEREIEERFYKELEFGTAGLRGIIGAGTNRMNKYVVRRATQGLAEYLLTCDGAKERGVAIAYDSRNKSDVFAKETALVLANNGIKTYLYSTLHSVPQLSFTILHLGCIAGVVITASHNPTQYNGYKVYWEHGGQAGPVQADEILSYIRNVDYFDVEAMDEEKAKKEGLLVMIGEEIDEAYFASTQTLLMHKELLEKKGSELKIVYTPLHGTGYVPVQSILKRIGINNVSVVEQQALPNGDFPTVKAPNPEDPDAFTLAFELADKVGADAILATDPDADRLGAAVRKKDGSFMVLTGNKIGSILIHYILSSKKENGTLGENGLVVKSLVSTRMADKICEHFGVEMRDVLTGFRYISEQIAICEETKEREYLFGFEESYGFLAGTFSRDKDGICAAMLLAEACVYYKEQGKTLYDVLMEMYETYGYYDESVKSYTLEGKEGIERIGNAMVQLRKNSPEEFASVKVVRSEDFQSSICKDQNGECEIMLPKSNVLRYLLDGGAWIAIRPSGTEPKLKLYIGANADKENEVKVLLDSLMSDADAKL